MGKIQSPVVSDKFDSYPKAIRKKLMFLRQLVFDTASEIGIDDLDESLKWGEPSYSSNIGSTIRIDWKESNPSQYAVYFNCKTKLVDTFKERYGDTFAFEGNRAIIFTKADIIPVNELKHCIKLSLTYHQIKHLPMLGV